MSVSRAVLSADVVGHDEDFGEEPVDGRAQRGDLGERARVVRPLTPRIDARPLRVERVEQRPLRRLGRARRGRAPAPSAAPSRCS